MRRWPFLLLLLIPFVDAIVLVVVAAEFLGALATVLLVVLTALVGMLLVRAEGRRTISRIQTKLARGEIPTNELMDGGLLIAAGAFLLTPGLVTDTIGFLLALPVTRIPIRAALKRYVVVPYVDERTDGFATGNVYTFGAPDDDPWEGGTWGPDTDPGPGPDDYGDEMDPDAYDIEFEDVDDED
ncbi:membrane protein FxsA [Halobacteriales archaeon QS_8_69_26]|nr:MAG: membrane protein FxsA [Halobacteriales archaeon QS_8_69_26]